MADIALHVCKDCCRPLPDNDDHVSCLQCLGIGHDMFACPACIRLDIPHRMRRRAVRDAAKETGVFPDDWCAKLYPELVKPSAVSGAPEDALWGKFLRLVVWQDSLFILRRFQNLLVSLL